MRFKVMELYKFNELPAKIQDVVIEKLWDINGDYNWWNDGYEYAKNIGLKLDGFELGYNKISGSFIDNAESCANAIIKSHGENCNTYKAAKKYLTDLTTLRNIDSVSLMPGQETDTKALDEQFLKDILPDYLQILKIEYEYRTSKQAIIDTIEANDYEFTIDGELDS